MTAKEMFEKLGYKQEDDSFNKGIHYHLIQIVSGDECHYGITFNKENKSYHTYAYGWFKNGVNFDSNLSIDYKLHQAINKQVEELGWLRGEDK